MPDDQPVANSTRFPFTSYPTGWFAVAFSRDLKPGDVKPIRNFGRQLVIFRTDSGRAVVSDPYCPHLGAHLGFGGTVEGETIRCPFHHWRFDAATGRCVAVPFAPPPPQAAIHLWPTLERNDVILVWHDLAGRSPLWEMPEFEPTEDPSLADGILFEGIRAHTQEILENGVDLLHVHTVHGTRRLHIDPEPMATPPYILAYAYRTPAGAGAGCNAASQPVSRRGLGHRSRPGAQSQLGRHVARGDGRERRLSHARGRGDDPDPRRLSPGAGQGQHHAGRGAAPDVRGDRARDQAHHGSRISRSGPTRPIWPGRCWRRRTGRSWPIANGTAQFYPEVAAELLSDRPVTSPTSPPASRGRDMNRNHEPSPSMGEGWWGVMPGEGTLPRSAPPCGNDGTR